MMIPIKRTLLVWAAILFIGGCHSSGSAGKDTSDTFSSIADSEPSNTDSSSQTDDDTTDSEIATHAEETSSADSASAAENEDSVTASIPDTADSDSATLAEEPSSEDSASATENEDSVTASGSDAADSEPTSTERDWTEALLNEWHLTWLTYFDREVEIFPEDTTPVLNIYRDENGDILADVTSCYESLEAECEFLNESEIRCVEYRVHSIIWGDEPFPCTDNELTVETSLYDSFIAYASYEVHNQTLYLISESGEFEAHFKR